MAKFQGVDSVAIHAESNLVYVVGDIDATTLLDKVAKLGKAAKLVPANSIPRNHVDEKQHQPARNHNYYTDTAPGKGKSHKNCCCKDGRHNRQKKLEEEDHKSEAYVAPTVDPRFCRDIYCEKHPHTGRVIIDKVPAESSTLFGMGYMPVRGGYGPYGGGSQRYPGWYGREQQQFGYGRPPMYLPPRPFRFQ